VTIDISTGIPFVGIGDDVFLADGLRGHGAPLATGRETCATASAQTRGLNCGEDLLWRCFQGFSQCSVTAMLFILGKRACAPGGDPVQDDSVPGKNLYRRTRMRLTLRWRGEAFAKTINARVLCRRFGPQLGIEMARRETRRALARFTNVFAVWQVIERLDVGRESVRRVGRTGFGSARHISLVQNGTGTRPVPSIKTDSVPCVRSRLRGRLTPALEG